MLLLPSLQGMPSSVCVFSSSFGYYYTVGQQDVEHGATRAEPFDGGCATGSYGNVSIAHGALHGHVIVAFQLDDHCTVLALAYLLHCALYFQHLAEVLSVGA